MTGFFGNVWMKIISSVGMKRSVEVFGELYTSIVKKYLMHARSHAHEYMQTLGYYILGVFSVWSLRF